MRRPQILLFVLPVVALACTPLPETGASPAAGADRAVPSLLPIAALTAPDAEPRATQEEAARMAARKAALEARAAQLRGR